MYYIFQIKGGVVRGVQYGSSQYFGVWFLIAFAYCAVNCFGLASGYILVDKSFKYKRIISLWLEVLFYSVGINVVFSLLNTKVSIAHWASAFFPVLLREYWYFTAYFGMFFFIPFFNKLLKMLNRKQLVTLFITIVLVISVLSSINREIFYLKSGYSMLWLCSLYVMGGIIRKLNIHLSTKTKVFSMVLCIIFALLATISRLVMHQITLSIFGTSKFEGALYLYASPLVLFEGIVLLLICKDIKRNLSSTNKKIIEWMSATSFGCYLIQVHPMVFVFFRDRFMFLAHQNVLMMIFGIILISLFGFLLASTVDWIRLQVFKKIKIECFASKLIKKMSDWMWNLFKKITGEEFV